MTDMYVTSVDADVSTGQPQVVQRQSLTLNCPNSPAHQELS